ncbi:MAG TPA: endospore germination permease [Clostridiaceae bacterium]|nr:endospore germination permease [Clostridiaceae bacterium]
MKSNKYEILTNRQIALIILSTIVGYGILILPKNAVENAGTAAWVAVALATIYAALVTYMFTYLGYMHPNMTMPDYSQKLVGKFFTFVFVLIYVLQHFVLFILLVKNTGQHISQTVLVKTPTPVIIFVFILVAFYAVSKNLRVVALVCEFYGVTITIGLVIICILLFSQGNINNMRPFLGTYDIKTYFKASLTLSIPFLGMETLFAVPIDKKNGKKVFKYTTIAILFIGFLYILIVESCISVRGTDMIIHYKDALIEVVRSVDVVQLEFLRRLDGLFIIIWIMAVFTTVIMYFYSTVFLLSKCFTKISYKAIAIAIMIIASFCASFIPLDPPDIEKALNYTSYFSTVTIVLIPLILIIFTRVKKHEKK